MPISYKINPARHRVFTHVTGEVTALEVIGHFETARREGFLPYSELIDASTIIDPTLSVAELWNIAVTLRKLQSDGNFGSRAVCVGSDANFVLAHMFASLISGFIRMRVFHDRITAEQWLNKQNGGSPASFTSG
jgi:hypothetical protein